MSSSQNRHQASFEAIGMDNESYLEEMMEQDELMAVLGGGDREPENTHQIMKEALVDTNFYNGTYDDAICVLCNNNY